MWDLIIDNPLNSRNTISLPITNLCIPGKSKCVQMSKLMKSGQIGWTKMNTNLFKSTNGFYRSAFCEIAFLRWSFIEFYLNSKWFDSLLIFHSKQNEIFIPFWKYFTLKVWGKDHLIPIRTTTTKIKTELKKTPKNRK